MIQIFRRFSTSFHHKKKYYTYTDTFACIFASSFFIFALKFWIENSVCMVSLWYGSSMVWYLYGYISLCININSVLLACVKPDHNTQPQNRCNYNYSKPFWINNYCRVGVTIKPENDVTETNGTKILSVLERTFTELDIFYSENVNDPVSLSLPRRFSLFWMTD